MVYGVEGAKRRNGRWVQWVLIGQLKGWEGEGVGYGSRGGGGWSRELVAVVVVVVVVDDDIGGGDDRD